MKLSNQVPSMPKAKKLFSSATFVKVLTYCTANILKLYGDNIMQKTSQINLPLEEVRYFVIFTTAKASLVAC